jgi:hypothetical protein
MSAAKTAGTPTIATFLPAPAVTISGTPVDEGTEPDDEVAEDGAGVTNDEEEGASSTKLETAVVEVVVDSSSPKLGVAELLLGTTTVMKAVVVI